MGGKVEIRGGVPISQWVSGEMFEVLRAMGLEGDKIRVLLAEAGGNEKESIEKLLTEYRRAKTRKRPRVKGPSLRKAGQKAAEEGVYG